MWVHNILYISLNFLRLIENQWQLRKKLKIKIITQSNLILKNKLWYTYFRIRGRYRDRLHIQSKYLVKFHFSSVLTLAFCQWHLQLYSIEYINKYLDQFCALFSKVLLKVWLHGRDRFFRFLVRSIALLYCNIVLFQYQVAARNFNWKLLITSSQLTIYSFLRLTVPSLQFLNGDVVVTNIAAALYLTDWKLAD